MPRKIACAKGCRLGKKFGNLCPSVSRTKQELQVTGQKCFLIVHLCHVYEDLDMHSLYLMNLKVLLILWFLIRILSVGKRELSKKVKSEKRTCKSKLKLTQDYLRKHRLVYC